MSVVPEACVFCGGRPLDPEHLLGDWMNRNPLLALPGPQAHYVGTLPGGFRSYASDQHDQKVPCVDGRCNHGWMSNMEQAVAKVLPAVASETAAQLPERACLVIALWAVTRVMVKQFQDPQPDPLLIPPEQYAYVHKTLEPPPATFVYRMAKRMAFPTRGLGVVAFDGIALAKFQLVVDVGDTPAAIDLGWQARVSKGAVHLGIASLPALPNAPDQLARQVFQDDEPLVQIWPLKTKASQIRVRHPRPRQTRQFPPGDPR